MKIFNFVNFTTCKQAGAERNQTFVVTDKVSVDIVKLYLNLFTLEMQVGRLLKGVRPSNQVVGTHILAKVPKEIALWMGKEDAARYTSHCFRRLERLSWLKVVALYQ